jgi:hypothetical protein
MIPAKLLAAVIEALCLVESGGRAHAVNGDCVGILQIRPVLVDECNRLAGGPKWAMNDRLDPVKSRAMALEYLTAKCPDTLTVFGVAMLWKKGPDGMFRSWTESDMDYGRRVENLVEAMQI